MAVTPESPRASPARALDRDFGRKRALLRIDVEVDLGLPPDERWHFVKEPPLLLPGRVVPPRFVHPSGLPFRLDEKSRPRRPTRQHKLHGNEKVPDLARAVRLGCRVDDV